MLYVENISGIKLNGNTGKEKLGIHQSENKQTKKIPITKMTDNECLTKKKKNNVKKGSWLLLSIFSHLLKF